MTVKFEDILKQVGDFGMYQKLLCFLMIFGTTGVCGLTFYVQIFILQAPPHWCRNAALNTLVQEENLTHQQLLSFRPPARDSGAEFQYSQCQNYDVNYTLLFSNWTSLNGSEELKQQLPVKDCDQGWDFDYSLIFPTVVSENGWLCKEDWKPFVVQTVFWVGNTIGSWIWGFINDMYGRRPTVVLSHLVYFIGGVATIFISEYYAFLVLRFVVGFSHHTISHLPFVLAIEFCGVSKRVTPLLTVMMSYTAASALTPWLAYGIFDWKYLTLVGALPVALVVLSWKLIPESPSWLLTRGREAEARNVLQMVARVNGRSMPEEAFHELAVVSAGSGGQAKKRQDKKYSVIDLLRSPNLCKNTILVNIIWMLGCLCYYGHCQNTANLGHNIYMSYFLGALVEVPCWTVPYLLNKLGRRWPLITCFTISGIMGILYAVVPSDMSKFSLALALVGRMTITAAYYICLQFGPEIFPTVVRGQGVAMSETLGSVAIFISPSIVYLGQQQPSLPLLIFGGLSLLGALVTLFLPETANQVLAQTIADGEAFGRSQGFLQCIICQKKGNRKSSTAADELESTTVT